MKSVIFPYRKYAPKDVVMTRPFPAAVAVLAAVVALAGCGSNTPTPRPTAKPASTVASQPTTPVASGNLTRVPTSNLPPYNPVIDPAKFTSKITNPLFPLTPGTTYIYEGTRDGVPRHTEVIFTKETKTIMGVQCIVVRDVLTSKSAIVEKTTDWYAQDKAGNVWYFGEDTAEYENGKVTSTAGTWLAGVDGALPGIMMKASPAVDDSYRQEYRPGVAEDFAKVLKIDAAHQVLAGKYTRVVVTEDTDLLDATKLEQKFYAPGVGYLGSNGTVNGHKEITQLTKILK